MVDQFDSSGNGFSRNSATPAEGDSDDDAAPRMKAAAAAAEDLADRLKELAGQLGAKMRPQRVQFGRGRLGGPLKRRSPKGFVLYSVNLQLLLPDGQLWSYSRSDAVRFPAGRFFDVRTDYANFARGRSFFGGTGFTFLGAVLGRYTFGLVDRDGGEPGGLCAICTEGQWIRYVEVTEALADIAGRVAPRDHAR
jgi:hypothetical protein